MRLTKVVKRVSAKKTWKVTNVCIAWESKQTNSKSCISRGMFMTQFDKAAVLMRCLEKLKLRRTRLFHLHGCKWQNRCIIFHRLNYFYCEWVMHIFDYGRGISLITSIFARTLHDMLLKSTLSITLSLKN